MLSVALFFNGPMAGGNKQEENLDVHDTNASWLNGGYPDFVAGENNMNEEWFGIAAKGMVDGDAITTSIHVQRTTFCKKSGRLTHTVQSPVLPTWMPILGASRRCVLTVSIKRY